MSQHPFSLFSFLGLLGYSYYMKMIDKVVVVKEMCKLFSPPDKCKFEDFSDTVASLIQFKVS